MIDNIDILTRICGTEDFFRRVFLYDEFDDWKLAYDLGVYLADRLPEECGGHLILARSLRHLGERERAASAIQVCKGLLAGHPFESDYRPEIEKEERLLAGG